MDTSNNSFSLKSLQNSETHVFPLAMTKVCVQSTWTPARYCRRRWPGWPRSWPSPRGQWFTAGQEYQHRPGSDRQPGEKRGTGQTTRPTRHPPPHTWHWQNCPGEGWYTRGSSRITTVCHRKLATHRCVKSKVIMTTTLSLLPDKKCTICELIYGCCVHSHTTS